jgi:hypothetical protein
MRAIVHDPSGPLWTQFVVSGLGALCIASGLLWAWLDGAAPGAELYAGIAVVLLAPFVAGRHAPRAANVELGRGSIHVRGAGLLDQTIRTRAICGASTTVSADGRVNLALARKWRAGRPVVLELESEADATRIRDALGIGHHGFGALAWPVRSALTHDLLAVARLLAAALALLLSWRAILGEGTPDFSTLFQVLGAAAVIAKAFERKADRETRVELVPQGVRYFDWGRWHFVSFGEITGVHDMGHGIALARGDGDAVFLVAPQKRLGRHGLSAGERAHLVAQIRDAARRAHGEGAPPPEVAASEVLARREGESARGWLERLDATARTITDGAGYRGSALSKLDLWNALGNHDAAADVRAGAARVLVRIANDGEAQEKIDTVLASMRDEGAKKRIRIALDTDLDDASRELDAIEDVPAHARRVPARTHGI